MMEASLHVVASYLTTALGAIALLMIVIGAIKALADIGLALVRLHESDMRMRAIFIEFARWLVAALSFQLAADIAATTIAPEWDELGRLAAIAAIRTWLTYFLDRDLDKARDEQNAPIERPQTPHEAPGRARLP